MDQAYEFAFDLLERVSARTSAAFAGLGLVLYGAPMRLPVAALGDQSLLLPALPVQGAENIAQVLADISTAASPWHDGFHLIDAGAKRLTHVCQFLAPPLALLDAARQPGLPVGARHLAAVAISKMESVVCTALLSNTGGAQIFRHGTAVMRPKP